MVFVRENILPYDLGIRREKNVSLGISHFLVKTNFFIEFKSLNNSVRRFQKKYSRTHRALVEM